VSRGKRHRKIISGNKRVKRESARLESVHRAIMAITVAMFQTEIGILKALQYKKGVHTSKEVLSLVKDEVILPLVNLPEKIREAQRDLRD
jgi:hypothetical protein